MLLAWTTPSTATPPQMSCTWWSTSAAWSASTLVGIYTSREEALATGAVAASGLSTEGMDTDSWSTDDQGAGLRVMFEGKMPPVVVLA